MKATFSPNKKKNVSYSANNHRKVSKLFYQLLPLIIAVFFIVGCDADAPDIPVEICDAYEDALFTIQIIGGAAIVIGIVRILRGWPLSFFILGGYGLVMLMTLVAPKEIIGLAYDLGGVTTSTVTVPLVTVLGVGLARTIHGRDPLTDGFGLIALASLTPMIFVMVYGLVVH